MLKDNNLIESDYNHGMTRPRQTDGMVHGVVVGCPDGQGRWLLIRRSHKVAAPGQVCFPGGAVEPGEDRADAARREFREELGINIAVTGPVWSHTFEDRPLVLFGYLGEVVTETLTPDPYEVDEVLWLTEDQVKAHPDAMPMTERLLEALEAAHAGRGGDGG